jgi:hypothetical protein
MTGPRTVALGKLAVWVALALLAGTAPAFAAAGSVAAPASARGAAAASAPAGENSQLETAAHKAGETGRKVAMSMIALGFAIAAIVLAFRRDFKEAVGVFAIGIVAVLLAQEAGVRLVENLVHSLFGS